MWLEMSGGKMVNLGNALFLRLDEVSAAAEDQNPLWAIDAVNMYVADSDVPLTLYEGARGKCRAYYEWLQCQIDRDSSLIRDRFSIMEDTQYVPYLMQTIAAVQDGGEDFVPVEALWELIGFTARNVFDFSLEGLVAGRNLECNRDRDPDRNAYRIPINQVGRVISASGHILPLG